MMGRKALITLLHSYVIPLNSLTKSILRTIGHKNSDGFVGLIKIFSTFELNSENNPRDESKPTFSFSKYYIEKVEVYF